MAILIDRVVGDRIGDATLTRLVVLVVAVDLDVGEACAVQAQLVVGVKACRGVALGCRRSPVRRRVVGLRGVLGLDEVVERAEEAGASRLDALLAILVADEQLVQPEAVHVGQLLGVEDLAGRVLFELERQLLLLAQLGRTALGRCRWAARRRLRLTSALLLLSAARLNNAASTAIRRRRLAWLGHRTLLTGSFGAVANARLVWLLLLLLMLLHWLCAVIFVISVLFAASTVVAAVWPAARTSAISSSCMTCCRFLLRKSDLFGIFGFRLNLIIILRHVIYAIKKVKFLPKISCFNLVP